MGTDAYIALQVLMMPRDTNGLVATRDNMINLSHLSIFGGVVRFRTSPVRWGRTSITMRVDVEAERGAEVEHVAEAEIVFVGIDPSDRRPVPLLPEAPELPSAESPVLPETPKIG